MWPRRCWRPWPAVVTLATVLVTRGATGSPLLVQGMNQGFSQQGFMEADTYFDTCCFLSLVVSKPAPYHLLRTTGANTSSIN